MFAMHLLMGAGATMVAVMSLRFMAPARGTTRKRSVSLEGAAISAEG